MQALRRFFVVFLCALAGSALAQDKKIVLRVADSFPANHYVVEYATKFWMDSVTKATGGAVTFEYYPSEQLGKAKDFLALTQSGVTDIAYVAPAFVSDKMPLSAVAELPGGFSGSCAGGLPYWKLVRDGILAQREFQPNGVRAIFAVVLPPYQIFTKGKLESIKNVEGMKLYTAGGAKELAVRKLKAVPIKMATPEVYESLSRGTIDGVLFPWASLFPYNVHTLVKYATVGENFGSFAATYSISEAKYKQLPASVQKAMAEASEATVTRTCALIDKDLERQIEKAKQSGVTLVQLPASDRKDIDAAMASIGKEWAESLDKRGKAGSEVLKAFQDALKAGR